LKYEKEKVFEKLFYDLKS